MSLSLSLSLHGSAPMFSSAQLPAATRSAAPSLPDLRLRRSNSVRPQLQQRQAGVQLAQYTLTEGASHRNESRASHLLAQFRQTNLLPCLQVASSWRELSQVSCTAKYLRHLKAYRGPSSPKPLPLLSLFPSPSAPVCVCVCVCVCVPPPLSPHPSLSQLLVVLQPLWSLAPWCLASDRLRQARRRWR